MSTSKDTYLEALEAVLAALRKEVTTMTAPTTGRLVELLDAKTELHVGMTKLHQLISSGELTRVRIGRRSFVTRESLDAFIDGLPTGTATARPVWHDQS